MAKQYNPFDQEHKDKNPGWYARTILKVGVLAGLASLAFKIKGPTGKLLDKYKNKQSAKVEEREIWKASDQRMKTIPEGATLDPANMAINLAEDEDFIAKTEGTYRNKYRFIDGVMDPRDAELVRKLGELERTTITRIDYDINNSISISPPNYREWYLEKSALAPNKADIDVMLFDARRDALYNYFNQVPPLDPKKRVALNTAIDPVKDKEVIKQLSEEFLSKDPDYTAIYKRHLQKLNKNYTQRRNSLRISKGNVPFTLDDAHKSLYNLGNFTDLPKEVGELFVYAGTHKAALNNTHNVFELLKDSNTRITSGSLHDTKFIPPDKRFQILGQFDYTPGLRRLLDDLDNLKTREKTGVSDVNVFIRKEGSFREPRFYLDIYFHPKTKTKVPVLSIPLSQWGRVPGSTADVRQKLDLHQPVPETYGKIDPKVHPLGRSNITQRQISEVHRLINGNLMDQYSANPVKAIGDMQNRVNTFAQELSTARGDLTDNFNVMFEMMDPKTANKLKLQDALPSINNLRGLAGIMHKGEHGAILIEVDLETLGRSLVGPSHQPKDAFTQIIEAGYNVSEWKNKKISFKGAQNYVSDHGFSIIDQIQNFTPEQISWFRNFLPERGKGLINDADVWNAYKEIYQKKSALSPKKFANSHDMAAQLINEIIGIAKTHPNQKIYLGSKNGKEFDLKVLEMTAPKEFLELKELLSNHIDMQGIARVKQIGWDPETSLSQDTLVKKMLGELNISPDAENLPKQVINALKHKGNSIFDINKTLLKDWDQKRWLVGSHYAVNDTIMATLLKGYEVYKIISGQTPWDQIDTYTQQFMNPDKYQTLMDQLEKGRRTERQQPYMSSWGLSPGQLVKSRLSYFTPEHMEIFPDNAFNKQFYQAYKGANIILRDEKVGKTLGQRTDFSQRLARRRLVHPALMTEGTINQLSNHYQADAMKNLFSNTLVTDWAFTLNKFGTQEGFGSVPREVMNKIFVGVEDNISLLDMLTGVDNTFLQSNLFNLQKDILVRANELRDARRVTDAPSLQDYQEAARQIVNEKNPLTRISSSDKYLRSHKGIKTFDVSVDGRIKQVIIGNKIGAGITMQAQIEYMLDATAMQHESFVMRGDAGKFTAMIDNSTWGMWGKKHSIATTNAHFLEKGYVGLQKKVIITTAIENLLDMIDPKNGGDLKSRKQAAKALKQMALDLKATWDSDNLRLIHKTGGAVFKNIETGTEAYADAEKYIGNVDMSLSKIQGYMKDARMVWTEQKVKDWYNLPGNDKESIKRSIAKNVASIEEELKNNKRFISHLTQEEFTQHIQEIRTFQENTLLPDLTRVKEGAQIPMMFEAAKKFTDDPNSPWEPIFFARGVPNALHGIHEGIHARSGRLKLKSNITSVLKDPYSAITRSTVDFTTKARRANQGGRFMAAKQARTRFINTLLARSVSHGNIKSLTASELGILIDNKAGLDLEKFGKLSINDLDKNKVRERLTKYFDEQGLWGDELEKAVQNKLEELGDTTIKEAINSKNFISIDAASNWARMAEKKGVFAYSKENSLGGVFTFQLDDLMKSVVGNDESSVAATDMIANMFKRLSRHKGSGIEVDPNNKYLFKVSHLIMHADAHVANVANLLNPSDGRESTVGYLAEPTKYSYNVLEAAKILENYHQDNLTNLLAPQERLLKIQYLKYILKGFLFDSGSVTGRAEEFAPAAILSRVRGAGATIERFQDIKRMGGWKNIDRFAVNLKGQERTEAIQKADAMTDRILTEGNMSDAFVTTDYIKRHAQFEVETANGTRLISYEQHMKDTLGKEATDAFFAGKGESYLYGAALRQPTYQNGMNPFIDSRINVITPEMADHVLMNDNELAVHSIYYRAMGGDFDGDQNGLIIKGLKNAQSLKGYAK